MDIAPAFEAGSITGSMPVRATKFGSSMERNGFKSRTKFLISSFGLKESLTCLRKAEKLQRTQIGRSCLFKCGHS